MHTPLTEEVFVEPPVEATLLRGTFAMRSGSLPNILGEPT